MKTAAIVTGLLTALGASAHAQELIQYDDVIADTQAAITCGFCATEKFGTIFYELGTGGGLPAAAFPFTLNQIQIAVASTQVTGGVLSGGYQCTGTATGGMVSATLDVYAGTAVPPVITTMPATGAWPGESIIVNSNQVMLERSVDTVPGSNMFNVQINQLMVGVMVPTPNIYVRVVITIGAGGTSSACTDLGFDSPSLSPFRDDNGRSGPRRNFIYQLGISIPQLMINEPPKWTWAEEVSDPITQMRGIDGDWMIRMDITRSITVPPGDAGVSQDSGPMPVDTGVVEDAGQPAEDAGGFADASVPTDSGTPAQDAGPVAMDPPTITGISPDNVAQGSSVSVTVVGTGFAEGLSLKIGAIAAEVKLLGGATTIAAEVPAGIVAGEYDVVVINADGQSAILPKAFTVKGMPTPGGGTAAVDDGCRCVAATPSSGGAWAFGALALLMLRRRPARTRR